jgi:hypothetical protein
MRGVGSVASFGTNPSFRRTIATDRFRMKQLFEVIDAQLQEFFHALSP